MDYSVISPRTCVLKVNIHCQGCEKDIHKVLSKVKGVTSILIDGENGEVRVSGTIDPYTLLKALEKIGKRGEIMWDNGHVPQKQNYYTQSHSTREGLDSEQLQHLSHIAGVKQVELTHTQTTKATFKNGSCKKTEARTERSVKMTLHDDYSRGQSSVRRPHGGGGSGFYGGGTSQCSIPGCNTSSIGYYGGGGGYAPSLDYCGCCETSPALPPAGRWDYGRVGGGGALPSAPPLQLQPPPPVNAYHSPFSDENTNGCAVM